MPRLNQKGVIVQLLIVIILAVGLAGGLYLVKHPTFFKPKASELKPATPETSFTLVQKDNLNVSLYVRSDIDAANLFSAKLKFPTDLLEVVSVKEDAGFIKNWLDRSYDNEKGTISLVGGVPDAGFKSSIEQDSQLLATFTFRAKSKGKGKITFEDSSSIFSTKDNINILTIKRDVEVDTAAAKQTAPPNQVLDITYELVPNWNLIGILVSLSTPLSAKDFLAGAQYANNKCDQIIGFDASKGQATAYFSDPAKAILNSMTELTTDSGYQVHCSEAVSFKLSGTFLGNIPSLIKGWNLVSLPSVTIEAGDIVVDANASRSLPVLSDYNHLSCDIIIRQKPGASGAATAGSGDVPSQEVYNLNSTDPSKKVDFNISQTEGYWVHCNQASLTSKPVPHPENYFSLWFDKDQTSLERDIKTMTLSGGQIVGWVKSKIGKMKKMEYAVMNCTPPTGASCKDQPTFTTVFDTVQSENPVAFKVKPTTGVPLPALSNLMFRLEDDQGNVLDPVEIYQGKVYENLTAAAKFAMSIGGGSGTSDFSFACEEGKDTISCSKVWVGQPSWYKPQNTAVNLTSPSPTPNPASGDLSKDGKVDLADASAFFSKCTARNVFNQPASAAPVCDVNGDGKINSFDLSTLVKLLIANKVINR